MTTLCHYAESRHAKLSILFSDSLHVAMLGVTIFNVPMLNIVMLSVAFHLLLF